MNTRHTGMLKATLPILQCGLTEAWSHKKRGLKQPSKCYSSPDTAAMAYLVLSNFCKGTTSNGSMPSQSFGPNHSNFIHKIINSANN